MKKIAVIVFALLMITGCEFTIKKDEPLKFSDSINEVTEKFNYELATCLVDTTKAEFLSFNRGDEINIIGEDELFYHVDFYGLTIYIDKAYIRTANDAPFEQYTGYSFNLVGFFRDKELTDKIRDLSLNEEVLVLDEFDGVLLVEVDGEIGYIKSGNISKNKIIIQYQPKSEDSPSNNNNNNNSNNHTPKEKEGDDGEDIVMPTSALNKGRTVYLTGTDVLKGVILADGTMSYIAIFNRDDIVKVTEYDEENATVVVDGYLGVVDRNRLAMKDDPAYATWDGYAISGARVYKEFELKTVLKTLGLNEKVHVIGKVDNVLIVELEDGTIGYMPENNVSETQIIIRYVPQSEPTNSDDNSNNSHNNNNDKKEPEDNPDVSEWTPEVK